MARKARLNLTAAFVAIPPDERPVGPFINDALPYGQKLSGNRGVGITRGDDMFCSDVMRGSNCHGENAKWAKGFRSVSSWDLSRGENPLYRGPHGEKEE
jgi:hypothetical protein